MADQTATEAVVRAAYHQLILIDRDCDHDFGDTWTEDAFAERLAAFPGGALLSTVTDGDVDVRLALDGARPGDLCERFDHVVEGAVDVPSGVLELFGTLDDEPAAALRVEPGAYRVTVGFRDFGEKADRCEVLLHPGPATGGVACTLGAPRSARDAEYRRQLRARFGRPVIRDVPYDNPDLELVLPAFAAIELPGAEPVFASTGGWEASDGATCEFLTSVRAGEDVLAPLLGALSHYQADPEIEVYDGRLVPLGRPIVEGSALDHLLLTSRRPGAAEPYEPLHPLGRHVDLLWAIPLDAGEADVAREHGTAAALDLLASADVDDPLRPPVSSPLVTIRILAGHARDGEPVLETVPAEAREDGTFVVRGSPGLAEGVAAGDRIRLGPDHSFEVLERGGNLCVQVLADEFPEAELSELVSRVQALGGYLDGGSDGASSRVRVFTVPVAAGFPAVEAAFRAFQESRPGSEWYFGNVYDPADGVTPLGWWDQR